jgi:hypothetical protein
MASRLAIAAQRGSATSAENRSSSSTKIGCPYPLMFRLSAPLLPRHSPIVAEPLPIAT